MFEMERIGRRIAQLRKQRNMTQMELADKLNISYQAVSNWERGLSMPDIAKLGELSALLDATIDELLDNVRGSQMIQAINQNQPLSPPIDTDELVYIAPLMKPTEVDRTVSDMVSKRKGHVDLSGLKKLFPFLSAAMLDEIAWDCYHESGQTSDLRPIAPFLRTETIHALVAAAIKDGQSPLDMQDFFPFMDAAYIDELAVRTAQQQGLNAISRIAPFVSGETINRLAREALEKDGVAALSPIMPFIDTGLVEEYLRKEKPYIK